MTLKIGIALVVACYLAIYVSARQHDQSMIGDWRTRHKSFQVVMSYRSMVRLLKSYHNYDLHWFGVIVHVRCDYVIKLGVVSYLFYLMTYRSLKNYTKLSVKGEGVSVNQMENYFISIE